MKKKFLIISLAILTGTMLSLPCLFLKKTKDTGITTMYVLQTGVFQNYENALNEQAKFNGAILYQEGSNYRVLVGASPKKESLEKVKNILTEQNISFYQKELQIFSNQQRTLQNYELLLEKAEEKEVILLLNQKILEKMVSI